ncbi:MAG: hypothetical protein ABWX92_07080 [Mycetocola sp.]
MPEEETESTVRKQHPARELYQQDRKFRVVKQGARLEGIVHFGSGNAWAGFSRHLKVGDVVTCTGWKPGMGTPSEVVNFDCATSPEDVIWSMMWPMQGLFTPYPMDGYLVPIPDGDEDLPFDPQGVAKDTWPDEAPRTEDVHALAASLAATDANAADVIPPTLEELREGLETHVRDDRDYTDEQTAALKVWTAMRGQTEVSLGALRRAAGIEMAIVEAIRRLIEARILVKKQLGKETWILKGAMFLDPTDLIAGREGKN